MARETRTVYPGKRNKGLSSTFQPPDEGRSVQWLKRYDKHGDKDEENSPKNVNNFLKGCFLSFFCTQSYRIRIILKKMCLNNSWDPNEYLHSGSE